MLNRINHGRRERKRRQVAARRAARARAIANGLGRRGNPGGTKP